MKRYVKSVESPFNTTSVKDSDWYRFISRVEGSTGMKVTFESKYDNPDKRFLTLIDADGEEHTADIGKITYYTFDPDDLV